MAGSNSTEQLNKNPLFSCLGLVCTCQSQILNEDLKFGGGRFLCFPQISTDKIELRGGD